MLTQLCNVECSTRVRWCTVFVVCSCVRARTSFRVFERMNSYQCGDVWAYRCDVLASEKKTKLQVFKKPMKCISAQVGLQEIKITTEA